MVTWSDYEAGLAGEHQIANAELAVMLSQKFLQSKEQTTPQVTLPSSFIEGLKRREVAWKMSDC
jgi:hypothetical protein